MVRDSRTNKHDTANIRSSPLPSSPSSISKKRSRFDPSNAQHTNTASTGQHRAPASDDNLDSSSRQRKRSKKDSDHTVTSSTLPSDNAVESSTESLETVVSATTDDKSYSVPSSHHGAVGGEDGDMAKAQRKADAMAAEARRALKGKQKAQIAPELQPDDHDKDDDETRSKASRAIESVRAQLATKDTLVAAQVSCFTAMQVALSCHVCLETLESPHSLLCGHVFCRKCLAQWFHRPDPEAREDSMDSAGSSDSSSDSDSSDESSSSSSSSSSGTASPVRSHSGSPKLTKDELRDRVRSGCRSDTHSRSNSSTSSDSESESDDSDSDSGSNSDSSSSSPKRAEHRQARENNAPVIRGRLGNHRIQVTGLNASNEDAVWNRALNAFERTVELAGPRNDVGTNAVAGPSRSARGPSSSSLQILDDDAAPPKSSEQQSSSRRSGPRPRATAVALSDESDDENTTRAQTGRTGRRDASPSEPRREDDSVIIIDDDVAPAPERRARAPRVPTGEHRQRNLVCPQCRNAVTHAPIKIFALADVVRHVREAELNGLFGRASTLPPPHPASASAATSALAPGTDENDATWGGLWMPDGHETADERRKRRAAVIRDRDDGVRRCGLCNWELDEETGRCNGCDHQWELSDDGELIGNESDEPDSDAYGFILPFNGALGHDPDRELQRRAVEGQGRRGVDFLEDSDRSEDDEDERDSADDAFIDDGPIQSDRRARRRRRNRSSESESSSSSSSSSSSALDSDNILPDSSRTRTGRSRGRTGQDEDEDESESDSDSSEINDGFIKGPARKYRHRPAGSGSGVKSRDQKKSKDIGKGQGKIREPDSDEDEDDSSVGESSEVDSDEDVAVRMARRRVRKHDKLEQKRGNDAEKEEQNGKRRKAAVLQLDLTSDAIEDTGSKDSNEKPGGRASGPAQNEIALVSDIEDDEAGTRGSTSNRTSASATQQQDKKKKKRVITISSDEDDE